MISVENICKSFSPEDEPVIKNVSVEIPSESISYLIGPSGSGKSTLLKIINRLIKPSSGRISINKVNDQEIDEIQWRRRIGYVVQSSGLLPHMSVQENIEILAKILGLHPRKRKERCDFLLESVGLDPNEFRDRFPQSLSGGQQQRVGIARALMEKPKVLLMDEPFGALDPMNKQLLQELIRDLNNKLKKTILIVSHDIEEMFSLGEYTVLLKKGEVLQKGPTQDLFSNPNSSYVANFLNRDA